MSFLYRIERDLYLRRTRVTVVRAVSYDDVLFPGLEMQRP